MNQTLLLQADIDSASNSLFRAELKMLHFQYKVCSSMRWKFCTRILWNSVWFLHEELTL